MLSPDAYGWRGCASRAAFLVDAAAYYEALAEVLPQAVRSVFILGWDLHSRVRMRRDRRIPAPQSELAALLDATVRARPELEIFVLGWDFSALYAAEREPVTLVRFDWSTHPRLHFAFDGELPLGASHHQKIVVVDDVLAFVGGLDLTAARWDTPEHRGWDARRRTPEGRVYGPFHDVQALVTGDAARALGELTRARWSRATGRAAPALAPAGSPWPPSVQAFLTDVPVALARTYAPYKQYPAVTEVARLHRDLIAAARQSLYIENEYFTSACIADSLAARLREPEGPEVVLVLPRLQAGWLEQSTMGALRARVLEGLEASDRFGRLRVYAPMNGRVAVNLHSKLMVVDDAYVKIGSANLSNRSLSLDSECDLVFLSEDSARLRTAFAAFRTNLLREHLGLRPGEDLPLGMPLIEAVERHRGRRRTLVPLDFHAPEWLGALAVETVIDPARPLAAGVGQGGRPWLAVTASAVAALLLARPSSKVMRETVSDRRDLEVLAALAFMGVTAALPLLPGAALEAYLRPPVRIERAKVMVAVVGYAWGRLLRRERVGRIAARWAKRALPWIEPGGARALAGMFLVSGVPLGQGAVLAGAGRVRVSRFVLAVAVSLAGAEAFRRLLALPRRRRVPLVALSALAVRQGRRGRA